MPQYKFIAIEGADGKQTELTGSTRSHAIRAGLQKGTGRRKSKTARDSLCSVKGMDKLILPGGTKMMSGRPGSRPMVADSTKLGHAGTNAKPALKKPSEMKQPPIYRIESMCAGSLDPFDSLPIPTNPDVDYLVRYLLARDPEFASDNPRRSWFPYALQSAPMMHSTLAMTAAVWRANIPSFQGSVHLEGIHQKGEAMREIMVVLAQLDDYNDGDINFIISAMSTLAIAEVLDSDFQAAETHLCGVYKLYSSRGDRDSFAEDFILCKATNIADIQIAAALGHRLRFPLLHTDHPSMPESIRERSINLPFDPSILGDGSCNHARIFAQVRQLLLARQSSLVSLEALRGMFNVVDVSILQHLYEDRVDASDTDRLSRALVLAAHVFMYVTLRRVPPNSPVVRRMCTRLQSTLEWSSSAGGDGVENKAAVLWIAFVGLLGVGEAARAGPEGQWFLNIYQSTARGWSKGFGLERGGARSVLSAFLWDEAHCLPLLAGLES